MTVTRTTRSHRIRRSRHNGHIRNGYRRQGMPLQRSLSDGPVLALCN